MRNEAKILGDTQVEVLEAAEEWQGGEESEEEPSRERTVKRRASESFERLAASQLQ